MRFPTRGWYGLAAVLALAVHTQAAPFAQLSSSETQVADTAPKVVTLNSNDAVKDIDNANGTVTLKEAGTYFVIAAGQVGSSTSKGQGNVRLWMRQNGKDIDNSNTEQTVTPGFTAVLVCQGVGEFKAGDKIQLMFSASKTGESLGMIASKPQGEPAIPSMIFTAFKVGGAFAQLSSTETQPAAAGSGWVTLNSTDAAKDIDNNKGTVTIKKAGTYFAIAAGQVGATGEKGQGTVRLWMKQNGKDVDNSNTEQTINPGFTAVLVCQGVMECKEGDKLELMQAATGNGVGMVASKPQGEPAVPSMILSVFRVESDSYAQLSSADTQVAETSGKVISLGSTDAAKEIDNAKGVVTLKKAGTYFAIAAGQVGATTADGAGSVKLWLKQNGKDVDNSNTEQTVASKYTAVLVCQGVGEFKAGDKLELAQSAKGKGVGMVYSKPKNEPAVPSMIFSLFKVD